jgi:hypothetical protein
MDTIIKDELLTLVSHILAPLIHQGFQSIYDIALKYKTKHNVNADVLRIFQDLLRNVIPNWNADIIENETKRISILCKYGDQLPLFLKTIRRAYVVSMTERPVEELQAYKELEMNEFIQRIYLFAAREIYNNPYLFSDTLGPKEIKENQRDTLRLISDSIRDVIRQSLPIAEIATQYLETTPERLEIALLGNDGSNNAQQVFTTYNVQEEPHGVSLPDKAPAVAKVSALTADSSQQPLPNLVHEIVLRSSNQAPTISAIQGGGGGERGRSTIASISNFIREIPAELVDDTVVQSTIEDLERSRI